MIDRDKISTPRLELTDAAKMHLNLILENDFTLEGKLLRIQVNGKGCDGFKYAVGFDNSKADDFVLETNGMKVLIDPFCAFYLQEGKLDYEQNLELQEDGFVVTNLNQNNFYKKFWKDDSTKIPPMIRNSND